MITFEIPIKTISASNAREHWAAKAKRVKKERAAAALVTKVNILRRDGWPAVLVILMTRVGPRRLDDDNLRGALKATRDGIAQTLMVDDASPLVRWEYEQRTGKTPTVEVRVWSVIATTSLESRQTVGEDGIGRKTRQRGGQGPSWVIAR